MIKNVLPVGVLAASALVVFAVAMFPNSPVTDSAQGDAIFAYHSYVCTDVTRADGTHDFHQCSHNFLTPAGKNAIMDLIAGGPLSSLSTVRQIALCNVTNGAAAPVFCYGNQSVAANGLGNATGTFAKVYDATTNPNGNWSISNTFTSTADGQTVNGTLLLNGSSTGAIIFANNTFTPVTLNTNDQITIRWNISTGP